MTDLELATRRFRVQIGTDVDLRWEGTAAELLSERLDEDHTVENALGRLAIGESVTLGKTHLARIERTA